MYCAGVLLVKEEEVTCSECDGAACFGSNGDGHFSREGYDDCLYDYYIHSRRH